MAFIFCSRFDDLPDEPDSLSLWLSPEVTQHKKCWNPNYPTKHSLRQKKLLEQQLGFAKSSQIIFLRISKLTLHPSQVNSIRCSWNVRLCIYYACIVHDHRVLYQPLCSENIAKTHIFQDFSPYRITQLMVVWKWFPCMWL